MRIFLHVFLALLILNGCSLFGSEDNTNSRELSRVISKNGHEAYIVETSLEDNIENTQVILQFAGGKCGAGAVSSPNTNLGLKISWVDGNTLKVLKPSGVSLKRNASGETIQCLEQKVNVIIENN